VGVGPSVALGGRVAVAEPGVVVIAGPGVGLPEAGRGLPGAIASAPIPKQ